MTGQASDGVVFDINGENPLVYDDIGDNELYISKFKKDGNLEWVNIFESGQGAYGSDISVKDDKITLFGTFRTTLDADPSPLEEEILTNGNSFPFQSFYLIDLTETMVSASSIAKINNTLSPNPASSILKTSNSNEKIISIKNLAGNCVGQYNASSIDVSDLPSGMYIVNTENNGEFTSQLISILY